MTPDFAARGRSLGLKLILVGALAFLLSVPALFVLALTFERAGRAESVRADIFNLAGGRQTISGPVLIAPATVEVGQNRKDGTPITETRFFVFTPTSLAIDAAARVTERRRSIYDAAVFDADIAMTGAFGALTPPAQPGPVTMHWERAVLALKFANAQSVRGVREAPTLTIDGARRETVFEPGISLAGVSNDRAVTLEEPGVHVPFPIADPAKGFAFRLDLPMSGGGALYFTPAGEDTVASLRADWPDPSFQGDYLPDARDIASDGFTAEWRIPYLARQIPRSFDAAEGLYPLDRGTRFGVEFVKASSPYQAVTRALKYALMFMGVVFLTFFLFEATTGARAHPAQYILLGLAQVVFYLLVLALAEHVGFDIAFAATALATVSLSGAYAATVFRSKTRGMIAFLAFAGADGLIYLLMKSEDYALLIGSVTSFAAIALTMYVTRSLDWYGERARA